MGGDGGMGQGGEVGRVGEVGRSGSGKGLGQLDRWVKLMSLVKLDGLGWVGLG